MILSFFAFITVLGLIPLICKLADKVGFVDLPDGRKQHEMPVPPLGGVVIFSVFLLFMMVDGSLPWAVFAAVALMLVVGIIDDAFGVNAKLKFALHFISASVMVLGSGTAIHSLGNLLGFGDIGLWFMAIPFSVACVVYIQNAVNMMDGVDGLAGGNSFLVFSWMALALFTSGHYEALQHILILMSCLAGFLFYNMRSPFRKNAMIFLGDAGSMVLGLMIAWYAITLSQGDNAIIKPVTIAWIIALPIFDSFALLVARLKEGKPPFLADRRHFHHHFQAAGFTNGHTTLLILLYSAMLGAVGFFGIQCGVPEYVLGWLWILLWVGHTFLTIKSEKFIRLLAAVRMRIQNQ